MLNMMKGISGIDVNIIFALSNQQQNIDNHFLTLKGLRKFSTGFPTLCYVKRIDRVRQINVSQHKSEICN